MGLYQPTVITPSSLNGTGVVDATQNMTVAFYINGTVPITGWKFIIMKNDTNSTVLYNSGWRREYYDTVPPVVKPVYGRNSDGELVPKTDIITAADLASAGVVNNYENGYKLRVDLVYQTYATPNTSNVVTPKELEMVSPAYFVAMERATFVTTSWLSSFGRYAWFGRNVSETATHISHSSFDPVLFNRWRLAEQVDPDHHILKDTGNLYGAVETANQVYGILKNGGAYAVRLTGQLESGLELDTGWYNFTTAWTDIAPDHVQLKALYVAGQPCVCVRFEADEGYDLSGVTNLGAGTGWNIYRIRTDTGEAERAGIIPMGETVLYDYAARNNTEYTYRAYFGVAAQDGYMLESNTIRMRYYWNWAIIETEARTQYYPYLDATHRYRNTMYHAVRTHQFQGNVVSGSLSNENKPYVADNFTPYPTVQKSSRTGLTGTLKAWVGRTLNGVFTDSVAEVERLLALSTRETVKFLKDRKGNLWRIEISGAIQQTMQDEYAEQPVEIQIPWVEVGDAKEAQIVSLTSDGLMAPGDDIVDTESGLVRAAGTDTPTGDIEWTREEEGYVGSEIGMDANGRLTQTYNDDLSYVPAALSIVNGNLVATTVVAAEE